MAMHIAHVALWGEGGDPLGVHGTVDHGARWLGARSASVDAAALAGAVGSVRGANAPWAVRALRRARRPVRARRRSGLAVDP